MELMSGNLQVDDRVCIVCVALNGLEFDFVKVYPLFDSSYPCRWLGICLCEYFCEGFG